MFLVLYVSRRGPPTTAEDGLLCFSTTILLFGGNLRTVPDTEEAYWWLWGLESRDGYGAGLVMAAVLRRGLDVEPTC